MKEVVDHTGGQVKTLMFVQLNPHVASYSETISTLKFADRVSGVELGAASSREGRDVRELMEQVISILTAFYIDILVDGIGVIECTCTYGL
ncbi:P-loop containing nucleoside triphosphate hydrolase [Sesbania bispinosa]|nr:P-loop containing nucleoside triphosphate hydrolase [Sesbania bispinosa]